MGSQTPRAGGGYVQRPSMAKLGKQTEMRRGSLHSQIAAMGGQLELLARFPDGAVEMSSFAALDGSDTK